MLALVSVNLLLSRISNDKTQKDITDLMSIIEPKSDNFANFTKAQDAIDRCIKKSIHEQGGVEVQIIGVSMLRSWILIRDIIAEYNGDNQPRKNLRFEFAVLDDTWKRENGLWEGRTNNTDREIALLIAQKKTLVDNGKLEISVFHYAHKPSIVGILINNQDFFKGICEFIREDGHFVLRVAENPWERFRALDENGRREISQFIHLFDWYKSNCLESVHTQTLTQ